MALRIVLDGRWLQRPMHGIARYTLELLRHLPLAPSDQLMVLYRAQDFDPRSFQRAAGTQAASISWIAVKSPLFSLGDALEIRPLLKKLRPDVVHYPGFWQGALPPCPWVMTLHDLIHLQPPVALKYAGYYRLLHRRLSAESTQAQVLTVSHSSARAIKAWAPALDKRVTVTYLGLPTLPAVEAPPERSAANASITQVPDAPYFLYVGNPKPHKNTTLLFVALRQCLQQLARKASKGVAVTLPQLVTVGLPETSPPTPWHRAFNQVTEPELHQLYAGATAVLMPSFEEGCGLPLLEAMAHRKPIVASDIAVFREILNGSGICLDPREPSLWGRALAAFFIPDDPYLHRILGTQARQEMNAQRFSWPDLAAHTYALYQSSTRPSDRKTAHAHR
jgi:glycosyltransferase involved in cell wall biosynthesis